MSNSIKSNKILKDFIVNKGILKVVYNMYIGNMYWL